MSDDGNVNIFKLSHMSEYEMKFLWCFVTFVISESAESKRLKNGKRKIIIQVTGVMTQGRGDGKEWVTSFKVSYGLNQHDLFDYVTDPYGNQKVGDVTSSN